jgi:hypothetical protein
MATVRITLRAKPRAKRSAVLRATGLSADVAIAAPPVDGAANEELVAVLAGVLGLPRSALRLVHGASSKTKVVDATGLDATEVALRLARAAAGRP